jgi:polar amino acid transport system ATP-binding protein
MSIVHINEVHKRFGSNEVLKGVTFAVEEGDIVAIIGKSGSGKSTLLRCINGLEKPEDGRICVDGQAVHSPETNLRLLRQRVGIVFQSFNLFPHLTAGENVTLAPLLTQKIKKENTRALAQTMLAKVGLGERIDAYPFQLSGGQQQRVAIARCMAMEPRIMLFDEATSALDPELVGEVLKVMEDMARQGMTMILVTHEMGFARNVATKVVFMHEGRAWEIGSPQQIFGNPQTEELKSFVGSVLQAA